MGDKECVARSVTNSYASQKFHNHSSHQVDMPQGFLPFTTDAKGQTLYEKITQSTFVLGDDQETEQSPDPQEGDRGLSE